MTTISEDIHFYFKCFLFSIINFASHSNITFKLEEQTLDLAGCHLLAVHLWANKLLHFFLLQILTYNFEVVGKLMIK